jgi:hypothetical protein
MIFTISLALIADALAVTVQWFTTAEQTMIVTIWQAMFAAASFLSNLIAYGFYQLHGTNAKVDPKTRGLYTWQWMTIVIAAISSVAASESMFDITSTPLLHLSRLCWAFLRGPLSNAWGIVRNVFVSSLDSSHCTIATSLAVLNPRLDVFRVVHLLPEYSLLCRVTSLTLAVIVLIFLPDSPIKARWASEEDKPKFVERVRSNDQGIKQKVWRSEQVKEIFTDPLPWLLFGMIFFVSCVVGGLNTFNSLLINKAFGFSTSQALLLGLPLAAFQVCLYFTIG